MNQEKYRGIFKDPELLSDLIKICVFFAPGFLIIGYFDRTLFLSLDWFKLLALSALFTTVFIFPFIITNWILMNLSPWKVKISLYRVKMKASKAKVKASETRSHFLKIKKSLRVNRLPAKERREISTLDQETDEIVKSTIKTAKELLKLGAKLDETHQSLKIGFADIFLDNMSYLYILFIQSLGLVFSDYLLPHSKSRHFKDIIVYFFYPNYLVMPWLLIGLFFIIFNKTFASRLLPRLGLYLFALVSISIGVILPFTIHLKA